MEGISRPYAEFIDQITSERFSTAGHPLLARLPDPTDESFLETALAGKADCLITGNAKHFPFSKRQGIAVLSPREFLDRYRKR